MATPPSGGTTPGSAVQYCYMFEGDKRPTKQLDALLRAIAMHIVLKVGDRNELQITPKKLAAFYKIVGGDYDSIFIEMPDSSISYIWQVTGCQHTLQPTDNDFAPPSIPALTPRGFSRWESVEILLGPEEHVPFLQFAVKNWNLRHPETGECFPADLPLDVFPKEADEEVDLWHKACGERLTREAASRPARPPRRPKCEQEPEPGDSKFTQGHSRNQSQNGTPRPRQNDGDYFGRQFNYVNAPPNTRPSKHGHSSRSPEKQPRNNRSFNDRVRRRSFPDLAASPKDAEPDERYPYDEPYLEPKEARRPTTSRRHSHPRHYSSDEDMDHEPAPPRSRRRQGGASPTPAIRRFSPPDSGHGSGSSSSRPHRPESDLRRRTGPSPLGSLRSKLSETVSSILPNGLSSRPNSRNQASSEHLRQRRSREQVRPSRLNRSHSDLDSDDSDLGPLDDMPRRRRRPEERDRDRYRDRGRFREDSDRDDERDSGSYRDRQHNRRPDVYRRTSSHADVDRRRDQDNWDLRDRERLKEERKKWDRERERRSPPEETLATPPLNGQSFSRRYPEPAYS